MALNFNAETVGITELGWWRAHHEKNKPKLIQMLLEQISLLWGFDQNEAVAVVQFLGEAVTWHDTDDWVNATAAMKQYYEAVKKKTGLTFDAGRAAELEVGWWKLHDELEHIEDKSPLALAFARLYGELFGKKPEEMMKAGTVRAEATREHDLAEDPATPPKEVETHWRKTGELLKEFYWELKRAGV